MKTETMIVLTLKTKSRIFLQFVCFQLHLLIYLAFLCCDFNQFYFKFAISQPYYDYIIIPSLENYVVVSFSILVLLASGVLATNSTTTTTTTITTTMT